MKLEKLLEKRTGRIEKALAASLPRLSEKPKKLNDAVRYAVLSGGKRVRPILVLAACEAVGGRPDKAMPAAVAIELIHSYSLAHDDLPCMDNDGFRRGKPTCHKKFGETTALLAGDALLTLAFKVLSETKGRLSVPDLRNRIEASRLIAEAAGLRGMVGGQAVDMEYQKKDADLPAMEFINTHKTGALIAVSTRVGALLGGGSRRQVEALYRYGKHLGLLFQIVDDILDSEGYAELFGISGAKAEAKAFHERARRELRPFGKRAETLGRITDFVLDRDH